MRRVIVPIIVTLLVLAALPVSAGKIGFVNAEQAIAAVEEGQAKFAELKEWQAPYTARLDQLRDQILALRQQLSSAQATASPEELKQIEDQELVARRAFEDERREYERELEVKKNEFLAGIAAKIGEVGSEYAEANGFDAVFLMTGQPMMYVADSADLTPIIIELYNERFPVN
jgi:Skp family chaperone for outer membrane proteins